MVTAQSITFQTEFSFSTTSLQSWKRHFFKNLSSSPFQCRSRTPVKRNSDRKEEAVLESKYRRDKWQVLWASILQTQADAPVFQLAGHKTASFPALRGRHFLWLLGHLRSQTHSPLSADGGQAELSICPVQSGSLQFTVCLQLVQTHPLSLPYFRSSVISSVPTSFHNLRPWYHAAKQQNDLISTDLVTTECSQGCWGLNKWGNLTDCLSELQVMDTQAEGSEHSETSGERERRQSLFPFRKHWKVFLL